MNECKFSYDDAVLWEPIVRSPYVGLELAKRITIPVLSSLSENANITDRRAYEVDIIAITTTTTSIQEV